ncbi:MAG: polysaccharide deacetylase, carbohydrate Esterase Family 4-like protein [Rhodospirillales bacterium]|jgi:polysaccharide deacetylase family protein (PEP-CTERM system associated)|nr:polysaccharide deacetylase, carbohydrate Esterase Family 4-like protein [Rhodospirillales bacterium]MDB5384344.1 polysaccharide deacetylase, carbohydrate Esterase Family 4-like protein [Rhodospirillales bacterium]
MTAPQSFEGYQSPSALTRLQDARVAWFACLPREITFTVDVESEGPRGDAACARMTEALMTLIETGNGLGTFFILGEVAVRNPGLVREIAARGHEVASHGMHHRALARSGRAALGDELARARGILEEVSGAAVLGFRAPLFSLDAGSAWAAECIAAAGFAYSSSVVPAWNPLHGWRGAPNKPFLFEAGLLEIPVPLGRVGPLAMPFLGGMYMRSLPPWRMKQFSRQNAATEALWCYCHPYDIDTEPDGDVAEAGNGRLARFFLRRNRSLMAPRLAALMAGRTSRPFAARLAAFRAGAAVFAV